MAYQSTHTGAQIDAAVDNATKVVANPTLDGTETEMSGIEIAGTKYKAGGGGSTGFTVTITTLGAGVLATIVFADGSTEAAIEATYNNVKYICSNDSLMSSGQNEIVFSLSTTNYDPVELEINGIPKGKIYMPMTNLTDVRITGGGN